MFNIYLIYIMDVDLNIFAVNEELVKCTFEHSFTITYYNLVDKSKLEKLNDILTSDQEINSEKGTLNNKNFKYECIKYNNPNYDQIITNIQKGTFLPYIDINNLFEDEDKELDDALDTIHNNTILLINENKKYDMLVSEIIEFN